jgi:predicted lipoprotein with Yx(FWY)xxD motif
MRSRWKTGAVAAIVALLALPALSALPTAASASPPGSGFGFGFGFGHHPLRHNGGGPTPGAAVVSVESGPYGPVLVVGGAGEGAVPATSTTSASYIFPAGTSLYTPTIDPSTYETPFFRPYQAGCTTVVVVSEAEGPLSCTGIETDPTADWPAFTTEAPPVAGPGVNRFLLGSVYRADLGAFQVTYAGHPLYLFDPGPDSFFGANFIESVQPLPPEHTVWRLVSPQGTPATGPATLETEAPQPGTTYSSNELAAELLPAIGGVAVSVYTFSGDSHFSHCYDACARDFIPVTTVGTPSLGAGVNPSAVGVVWRADGTQQVTYDGHPLYFYSQEVPLLGSGGPIQTGTTGNGAGVSAFGGTLNLISP